MAALLYLVLHLATICRIADPVRLPVAKTRTVRARNSKRGAELLGCHATYYNLRLIFMTSMPFISTEL